MKKIFLQMSSQVFDNNSIFTRKDWNGDLDCWKELKSRLLSLGYELITADERPLDECVWIIFSDSSSLRGSLYNRAINKNMKEKMILLLWEGKIVNQMNYDQNIWAMFDRIMTWDDSLVDNKKFFKYFLPTPNRSPLEKTTSFKNKKLLVNVSINKYSSEKNELYSAREKSISYFTKNHPGDFDLFGIRWNTPNNKWQKYFPWLVKKYSSYRGMTEDKLLTSSKYKFALCYENMSGINNYITEKIFDAMNAGTVPIYWGADNIGDYIDPEAFIDRRKFRDDTRLADFLIKMPEEEYDRHIKAGRRFLKSEIYKKFLPSSFCDTMIKAMNLEQTK